MRQLSVLARAAVGGVLIYAGFMKAVGPSAEFAAAIAAYRILPLAAITPLAIGLPYIEMWIGLFVLTGLYTRPASLTAAVLFGMFMITLGSALIRGIDLVSCGCFGADALSPKYTILMDTVLLAFSLFISTQTKIPPPLSLDGTL